MNRAFAFLAARFIPRNPAVREILSLVTGVQPSSATIDPETSVALGAAILSSIMDNQMMDMQVQQQNCSKCVNFPQTWLSFISCGRYMPKAEKLGLNS